MIKTDPRSICTIFGPPLRRFRTRSSLRSRVKCSLKTIQMSSPVMTAGANWIPPRVTFLTGTRSEERRVGKECRGWRWASQEEKVTYDNGDEGVERDDS